MLPNRRRRVRLPTNLICPRRAIETALHGLGLLPGSSGKTLARAGYSLRLRRDEAAADVATAGLASSDLGISKHAPRITTISLPTYNSLDAGHPAASHTAARGSARADNERTVPPAGKRRSTPACLCTLQVLSFRLIGYTPTSLMDSGSGDRH